MSNRTRLFINIGFLFCLLACLSCNPKPSRDSDNVYINMATTDIREIIIDGDRIVLADSIQRRNLSPGAHTVKLRDSTISFTLTTNEHVLINPSRDTVIMEEVLYKTVYNGNSMDAPPFQSPMIIFSMGDKKYAGPYKLFINEFIVKGWDFGIGQQPASGMDWESNDFKGTFNNHYFKINTTSEFRGNRTPLNYTNEWIEPEMQSSIIRLQEGYQLSVEQGNFLVVEELAKKDSRISVGKLSTDNNDVLHVRETNLYKETEHGKITQQVAVIGNCILEGDNEQKKRQIEIVLSDKSHQPHIRLLN